MKTTFADLKYRLYLQAYYGQRVNIPPYFNSAAAPGHAPHPYMWGPPQVVLHRFHLLCYTIDISVSISFLLLSLCTSLTEGMNNLPIYCFFQPMMHPYGPPYAPFYSHGGVYSHPAVAIVSLHSRNIGFSLTR